MSSIRLRLLIRLVGPLMLVNLGAAALSYQLAWKPAQRAFDQSLSEAAQALALRPGTLPAAASDGIDQTWYALRDSNGALLAGTGDLPLAGRPGSVSDAMMRGEAVRVAIAQAAGSSGPVRIGVARTVRARTQVRDAIVRTMVALEVVVSLALAGVVWLSVTNGLAPLARLRSRLDGRESGELEPLDEHGLPDELAPVVVAFNDLLGRAAAGARAQQEFQANVAHQLRTPLAGLKLQLEWLAEHHKDDAESRASLDLMLRANERLIREVNQLLALARAEPSHFETARLEALDLSALVADAVQALVDQAVARGIDLGFALTTAPVRGDRFLLRDLLDNMVDNALRYTPEGGSVTVRVGMMDGAARLVVEDTGPGIPPAQRARVFQRFVRLDERTTGSGLGLAIVRDIAQLHGAQVELGNGPEGRGAVFTVRFPSA
ncbi:sensor histidine kinase [Massilia terrae]|uniref:histidine kinase n=1 Tax=Massilia terrae TaxID=1811224 RepID=A0ABT2CTW3_9BURK|nr:sensor histidine kinase [Massilia terrae]MCS0657036.1 ATP-binding protein [Massilia terrae]